MSESNDEICGEGKYVLNSRLTRYRNYQPTSIIISTNVDFIMIAFTAIDEPS